MPIGGNLNLKRDKVIPDTKKKKKTEEKDAVSKVVAQSKQKQENQSEAKVLNKETEIVGENYKIVITPSKRKKVKKTNIDLSGDLSITNIEKINEQIMPILANYDFIDMYLTNVDNYDLSTIQLLYTYTILHDTEDKSKLLKVIADLPIELKKLTQACGFSEFIYHYQG